MIADFYTDTELCEKVFKFYNPGRVLSRRTAMSRVPKPLLKIIMSRKTDENFVAVPFSAEERKTLESLLP